MARDCIQYPRSMVSRAFTLVEILVVLVILGTISAIVIPQIGSRDDLRCAAASRILMGDLIYAQNLAITSQKPIYVRFGTNTYSLFDSAASSTPITHPVNKGPFTQTFGSGGTPGLTSAFIESKSFDGTTIVAFDELGAPYSYNSVSSTTTALSAAGEVVMGSGNYRMKVSVEPFTGEITVTKE